MNTKLLGAIKKVFYLFKKAELTLSVAESCTGGLLSHCLTYLPGSSNIFIAGVVSYSESAKINILGVSSETISSHGVVSSKTAEEMAERIRLITGSDYSISTTGNLGPDVLEGKEKGLVYIGIAREGMVVSREIRVSGDRDKNREEATLLALRYLVEIVSGIDN